MTIQQGQIVAEALWALMLGGAGLVSFGLFQNTRRFLQWRQVRDAQMGEVVPLEETLLQGHTVILTPADEDESDCAVRALPATIAAIGNKTLRFCLHLEPTSRKADGTDAPPPDWLAAGNEVVATVTGASALYRLTARIQGTSGNPATLDGRAVTVLRPHWMTRIQRRQHARAALRLPATFEPVDVLAVRPLSGRPLLQNLSSARLRLPQHATLLDLSGGGLRAEIGAAMGVREAAEMCDAFPTDTLIKVRLPFCTLSDTPMLARIRSVEKIAARGGLGIRLACEFLPMAPWEQEIIIHEVFLAQREQMRRRI